MYSVYICIRYKFLNIYEYVTHINITLISRNILPKKKRTEKKFTIHEQEHNRPVLFDFAI